MIQLAMKSRTFAQSLTFPILRGSEDVAAIYNILYRQLFDRHRDLSLADIVPASTAMATSLRCIRARSSLNM